MKAKVTESAHADKELDQLTSLIDGFLASITEIIYATTRTVQFSQSSIVYTELALLIEMTSLCCIS